MKPVKIVVDILLLLCFIILMFFRETGPEAHIAAGLSMIVLVWIHVILNRLQIKAVIRRKITKNDLAIKGIAVVSILLFGFLSVKSAIDVLPKLVDDHDRVDTNTGKTIPKEDEDK
ncbi:hypothetical protein RyT2_12600 [Pseudolactococcus yaeyamensis]